MILSSLFTASDQAWIWLPFPHGRRAVNLNQLVRFEGQINYTRCFFSDGTTLLVALTLKKLLERLPAEALVRLHRKHAVNPRFIAQWNPYESYVRLSSGEQLTISRRRNLSAKASLQTILIFLILLLGYAQPLLAQLGMGSTPHPSAVLDLKSPANDKAFYPPRLSTAQRLALPNAQPGALVFDLDKATLYLYDGQNWFPLIPGTTNALPPIDRVASDGAAGDKFGNSVAISGDYAIVGASGDNIGNNDYQGSAYLIRRSGTSWIADRKVTDNSPAITRNGSSVGLSNGAFIIGGPNFQNGKGKVSFGTVD